MTSLRGKPVKLLVVFALTIALCLAIAGAASAAPAVTVNADSQSYTCSMKDDVSFTFDITGLNSVAACFTDPNLPATITVDFPANFDLTPAQGLTVPIKVYVNESGWFFAQPTPVIDTTNGKATITVPILPIPNANSSFVSRIIVGDAKQNIKVDVGCFNDGTQNIKVIVATKCAAPQTITGGITVYDIPYSIEGLSYPATIYACDSITVTGRVYNCKGEVWVCKNVTVTLAGQSVTVQTDGFGWFTATIPTPAAADEYTLTVTAGTAMCGTTVTLNQPITVLAKAPAKLQWLEADGTPICDAIQMKKECTELIIQLRDNCPATNPCNGGNVATAPTNYVINLNAIIKDSIPPVVGAHFFANSTDCANDTNQIGEITIPQGASQIAVWVKPIVDGYVVVEARKTDLTADSFTAHVYQEGNVTLKLTTKVADVNNTPRIGWPVQAAAWLDTDWCNACNKDFSVMVEMKNVSKTLTATWGNTLTLDYGLTGPNGSGASYSHSQYMDPDKNCKSHFYIYANPVGDVDCDFTGSLDVRVKVTCNATGITYATPWQTISYTSPVELARDLRYDSWQTLSTPKTLAGTGNMPSLLGNNYSIAYVYDGGKWINVGTYKLKPLYCYYAKMKQGPNPAAEAYTANYIYQRTTSPSGMIPPTRALPSGWSAVGVAEPSNGDCYNQDEYIYRMLGSMCKLCKKVVNPGNELGNNLLGNLADFKALAIADDSQDLFNEDPDHEVYNGDNYWLWLDGTGTIVAETGPDLPTDKPYGAN